MEQILKILTSLHKEVDFRSESRLVSDHILDSIDITTLIAELETEFDIEIGMEYMSNEHFDSVQAIYDMVQEIMEE